MITYHELKPVYDKNSKVLILGSMPSVKSKEVGFYYGHKQNRFWKVLSDIFNEELFDIASKRAFLEKYHIALWDVIKECEITGSSDNSIKNVKVNDLNVILNEANIKAIFVTGKVAEKLYNKYCYPNTLIKAIYLPSTSPANQQIKYEELKEKYKEILKYL